MKFGFAIPAYGAGADGAAVADLVAAGDEFGYDSAWLPDHVAVPDYAAAVNLSPPFLEPMAACAWGSVPPGLRFGTDVLVAPYRHPLVVAAMVGTLGRLAGDRLVLGVGSVTCAASSRSSAPTTTTARRQTEEWVRAVRNPPDGFSVVDAPTPIPIWIGGNSAKGGAAGGAASATAGIRSGCRQRTTPTARRRILEIRSDEGIDGEFTFSFSAGFTHIRRQAHGRMAAADERAPTGSEFRYAPGGLDRTRRTAAPCWIARRSDRRPHLLADAGVDHVTLRFGSTDPHRWNASRAR